MAARPFFLSVLSLALVAPLATMPARAQEPAAAQLQQPRSPRFGVATQASEDRGQFPAVRGRHHGCRFKHGGRRGWRRRSLGMSY